MNADDLLVEVRSPGFDRVGLILPEHVELAAEVPVNAIGEWTLTTPLDGPMSQYLLSEGYGLCVSDRGTGEVLFSGPSTSIGLQYTESHPKGRLIVTGKTDEVALDDALAWPDPDNDDETNQLAARDTRNALPWLLVQQFVNANIGSAAEASRKHPHLQVEIEPEDFPDGVTAVEASARFDNLLTLIQGIAQPAKVIFRVRQSSTDNVLRMTITPVVDSDLTLTLGTDLGSASLTLEAPGSTRIFVGGDGSSTSRSFIEYTDAASLDAEEAWGRRIERFAAATGGTLELQTAGKQALAQDGFAKLTARFEPTENLRQTYGVDWHVGDNATVVIADRRYVAPITGLVLKADSEGLRMGVNVGDVTQTGNDITRRLSNLETYR